MSRATDRKTLRDAAVLLERVANAPQERTDRFAVQAESAPADAEAPQPDQCMDVARRLRAMARR